MTRKNGQPCTKCGTSEWNSWGNCRKCNQIKLKDWHKNNRSADAEYRTANIERERARVKAWHASNVERELAYRKANRDRDNAKTRAWRANNKARELAYREANKSRKAEQRNAWYAKNKQHENSKSKAWRKANPDALKAAAHRRRARNMAADGSFTPEEWRALVEQYGGKCACCGASGKMTVDHIVPLVNGGTNRIDNLQPLCLSCNSSKGARTIDYRTNR